jgi:hypothetical protein
MLKTFNSGLLRFWEAKRSAFFTTHPARTMNFRFRQPAKLIAWYIPIEMLDKVSFAINDSLSMVPIIITTTIKSGWLHIHHAPWVKGLSL